MVESFVIRAEERGFNSYASTRTGPGYLAGYPDAVLTRHSSFNFHEYQGGRDGFGRMRVFGDEVFAGAGSGYNIHRHHNMVICAFVLQGKLTHINTVGNIDQLTPDDYYVFSAGSGGKHAELNLGGENMHAIYMWFLPDELLREPNYSRGHFDREAGHNRITTLVGNNAGALPIPQDVRVSRLTSDAAQVHTYEPASLHRGLYIFVVEGEVDCSGTSLRRRDSIGVWDSGAVTLRTGTTPTDVLIVESAR